MSAAKFTVNRRDFVKRAVVTLRCEKCGTTVIRCHLDDADLYESGMREHVCRISQIGPAGERVALRKMLRHMAGGAL